jgi:hypothetical protein
MKFRILVMVGLLGISSVSFAGKGSKNMNREAKRFERVTGVELHVPREDESKKKMVRQPVDIASAKRMLPVIMDVLMEYPDRLRELLLSDLTIYGKLKRGGKAFLGQAHAKSKSIDIGIRRGTSDAGLRRTMHHEFSHLIELHPKFPADKWKEISEGDYGTHQDGPKRGGSFKDDGFVTRYASKNRHEDFAELAELAFTRPEKAKDLAERYPEIGEKLKIMTRVYRKVAPDMVLPWIDEA